MGVSYSYGDTCLHQWACLYNDDDTGWHRWACHIVTVTMTYTNGRVYIVTMTLTYTDWCVDDTDLHRLVYRLHWPTQIGVSMVHVPSSSIHAPKMSPIGKNPSSHTNSTSRFPPQVSTDPWRTGPGVGHASVSVDIEKSNKSILYCIALYLKCMDKLI